MNPGSLFTIKLWDASDDNMSLTFTSQVMPAHASDAVVGNGIGSSAHSTAVYKSGGRVLWIEMQGKWNKKSVAISYFCPSIKYGPALFVKFPLYRNPHGTKYSRRAG